MRVEELLSGMRRLLATAEPTAQRNLSCERCQGCDDCKFCQDCQLCRSCTQCERCQCCESCTQCRRCQGCTGSSGLQDCRDCHDSRDLILSVDCRDCAHCLACVGLQGAQYCLLNEQLSPRAYFARLKSLQNELASKVESGWCLADLERARDPGAAPARPAARARPGLSGAGLSRSGLSGAGLSGSGLSGSGLSGSGLAGAGLSGSRLSGAGLSGPKFLGSGFGSGVQLDAQALCEFAPPPRPRQPPSDPAPPGQPPPGQPPRDEPSATEASAKEASAKEASQPSKPARDTAHRGQVLRAPIARGVAGSEASRNRLLAFVKAGAPKSQAEDKPSGASRWIRGEYPDA